MNRHEWVNEACCTRHFERVGRVENGYIQTSP